MKELHQSLLKDYQSFYQKRLNALQTIKPELAQKIADYNYQIFLSEPEEAVSLYVCGLKPYARAEQTFDFPPQTYGSNYHAYIDEDWNTAYVPRALQLIRLIQIHLLNATPDTRRTLVSNWFFQRAEDAKQLKAFGCRLLEGLPFHRTIIHMVQPSIILCIGNGHTFSSFAGMCALHETAISDVQQIPYIDRSSLKLARANGRLILGVPHLSRYPVTEELTRWLQTIALMK
jgi:hypothetical protein